MATTTSHSDATPPQVVETSAPPQTRGVASIAWSRFFRSKTAVLGLLLVCCLILTALLADHVAPYSPYYVAAEASLSPPSRAHPLGTDLLGRDMLSRILHGSRISLLVGFVSIFLALLVGVPLGLMAGFFGGKFDLIAMLLYGRDFSLSILPSGHCDHGHSWPQYDQCDHCPGY